MDVGTYIQFMEKYCDCYEMLNALEQEKIDIVIQNQLYLLENIVKREEAAVLQARGLEVKRQEMQKKIGADGKTMQEIIDSLEGKQQQALREVQTRLGNQVKRLQGNNKVCGQMIHERLKEINQKIEEIGSQVEDKKEGIPLVNRSI